MKMKINMSSPDITELEREAVNAVMHTISLSNGERIVQFEKRMCDYLASRHAIGVSSGTSGLHLCMIAAGIHDNDVVITTPFSFIASANAILYERAIPLFVDVDEETGNINPDLVAAAVHELSMGRCKDLLPPALRNSNSPPGPVKAIMPVHAFGQPADMDPIMKAAQDKELIVVEDACEALGSEYKNKKAGLMGDAAVFAFYPNKQITTGEGGMIVTTHAEWDALFRSLRNQGRDEFNGWLNHNRLGYNYRMDELSAALGIAQMQRIDELIVKRSRVAEWYNQRLTHVENIHIPDVHPNTTRMSWFVYVIRIKPPIDRDQVIMELHKMGIPSRPYFTPIHLQPFYRQRFGYREGDFPVTEKLGRTSLALPFSSAMEENEVDDVCQVLTKLLKT
jgi:perosamine synthetase